MNLANIAEGWYNEVFSAELPDELKDKAKARLDKCSLCTNNRNVAGLYYNCKGCGCKLPQKAYSFSESNKCPLNKW